MKKRWEAGAMPASRSDDAAKVLVRLVRQGWSSAAIASAAGLPRRTMDPHVVALRAGEPVRLQRHTADLVLQMGAPTCGWVGPAGPSRRLQALAWMGWSLHDVAGQTGVAESSLAVIRRGRRGQTSARAAAAIAEAYDRVCMTPGPSPSTAVYARTQGWVGPLAWDEDDIDEPGASPQGVADHGKGWRARINVEDVEELLEEWPTVTTRQLAERFGVGPTAVHKHLTRKGRQDLLDVLNRNAILATNRGRREPAA